MDTAIFETNLDLPNRRAGKVRDLYDVHLQDGQPPGLLLVATDRISAYDVILPTPLPGKGRLLTEISLRWFDWITRQNLATHHVISSDATKLPIPPAQQAQISGRVMLCRMTRVVPIECVVRGYLAGSGWREYQQKGTVCGLTLPPGLRQCEQLPEPIFTPATKATEGHDENISFPQASELVGEPMMTKLRELSIRIYDRAREYAAERGIIIADTKFEFGIALDASGRPNGELLLVDEALTPDSSRFWPIDRYDPGRDQESFDKQFVRNYLDKLVECGQWDKTAPGPQLPEEIVNRTLDRYAEARDRLFSPAH